jgi:hypothetical protein
MFRRQANIPRKGRGLAFQAPMEGLTGTHEEIIVDQITDAMKVMAPPKRRWRRACAWVDAPSEARTLEDASQWPPAPRGLVLRERDVPGSGIRLRWAHEPPGNKGIFVRAFWAALVAPAGFH